MLNAPLKNIFMLKNDIKLSFWQGGELFYDIPKKEEATEDFTGCSPNT